MRHAEQDQDPRTRSTWLGRYTHTHTHTHTFRHTYLKKKKTKKKHHLHILSVSSTHIRIYTLSYTEKAELEKERNCSNSAARPSSGLRRYTRDSSKWALLESKRNYRKHEGVMVCMITMSEEKTRKRITWLDLTWLYYYLGGICMMELLSHNQVHFKGARAFLLFGGRLSALLCSFTFTRCWGILSNSLLLYFLVSYSFLFYYPPHSRQRMAGTIWWRT